MRSIGYLHREVFSNYGWPFNIIIATIVNTKHWYKPTGHELGVTNHKFGVPPILLLFKRKYNCYTLPGFNVQAVLLKVPTHFALSLHYRFSCRYHNAFGICKMFTSGIKIHDLFSFPAFWYAKEAPVYLLVAFFFSVTTEDHRRSDFPSRCFYLSFLT